MKKMSILLLVLSIILFSCNHPMEEGTKDNLIDSNSTPGERSLSGSNLSPSATDCRTDSMYNSNFDGNKARDGSMNTKWCTTNATSTHWIKYNLGGVKNITGFVVKHAGAGGELSIMNTRYFQVKFAHTDNAWESVTDVDNSAQANITERAVSVQAQYVMLYITNSGADNYTRIYEFEVWGTSSGGNITPGPTSVTTSTPTPVTTPLPTTPPIQVPGFGLVQTTRTLVFPG